ncbi:MAG: prolipoprotein diacylglyceryl transferase [Ruminiclostridium sp.]|nr:prolipoprotein diacylglyceryl transferase [Ruminiclostridium sp.]
MNGMLNLLAEAVTDKIEFPNLFSGSIAINRVAFNLFGMDVYWYGIIIALGVILAFIYAMKRTKQFGLIGDHVFDVVFVAIIFGFIGARAYYCIFINAEINFFDLRHGGLAIYGGIIGAALAAAVMCVIRKVKLPALFDLGGLGLLIGQGIGRWGNFVNQEAYGAPTAGTLPWGMTGTAIIEDPIVVAMQNQLDKAGEGIYALVHPCFLYESLLCFVGFILLHIWSKKLRTFDGEIFLLYVMWYGTGRALIEGLRTDSLMLGDIRVSQLVGIVSAIVALVLLIVFKIKLSKKNGYVIYCETAESKEKLEAYELKQLILEEKAKAKKAMKNAEEAAPSILAEGTEDITIESDYVPDAKEKDEADASEDSETEENAESDDSDTENEQGE